MPQTAQKTSDNVTSLSRFKARKKPRIVSDLPPTDIHISFRKPGAAMDVAEEYGPLSILELRDELLERRGPAFTGEENEEEYSAKKKKLSWWGGPYVSDHRDDNAGNVPAKFLAVVDIDGCTQKAWLRIKDAMTPYLALAYGTSGDKHGEHLKKRRQKQSDEEYAAQLNRPRYVRLVFTVSREMDREEFAHVSDFIGQHVTRDAKPGEVAVDASMYQPSRCAFGLTAEAFCISFHGKPLDVDSILEIPITRSKVTTRTANRPEDRLGRKAAIEARDNDPRAQWLIENGWASKKIINGSLPLLLCPFEDGTPSKLAAKLLEGWEGNSGRAENNTDIVYMLPADGQEGRFHHLHEGILEAGLNDRQSEWSRAMGAPRELWHETRAEFNARKRQEHEDALDLDEDDDDAPDEPIERDDVPQRVIDVPPVARGLSANQEALHKEALKRVARAQRRAEKRLPEWPTEDETEFLEDAKELARIKAAKFDYFNARYLVQLNNDKVTVFDRTLPPQHCAYTESSFKRDCGSKFMTWDANKGKDGEMTRFAGMWLENVPDKCKVRGDTFIPRGQRLTVENGAKWHNSFHMAELPKAKHGRDMIHLLHEHLAFLVPDEEERAIFMGMLAWPFQRMGESRCKVSPLHVATATGTGRGFLVDLFTQLLGLNLVMPVGIDRLAGRASRFTDHIAGKLALFVNEVAPDASKRFDLGDALNEPLEANFIGGEMKNRDAGLQRIYASVFMFTNNGDALALTEQERRIMVITGPTKPKSPAYYDGLYALLHDEEFLAQVREYFASEESLLTGLTYGGKPFNFERAPMTPGKRRMIESTAGPGARALGEWLQLVEAQGDVPRVLDAKRLPDTLSVDAVTCRHGLEDLGYVPWRRKDDSKPGHVATIKGKSTYISAYVQKEDLGMSAKELTRIWKESQDAYDIETD